MAQRLETGRLAWNKAKITIGDGPTQDCRFHGDGTTFTATDPSSEAPIATWTIPLDADGFRTVGRVDGKTFLMLGEDGTEYLVRSVGCGCNGG